jgi:hypothetical protein
MQTIIFYGRNGAGAKERAKELRGEKKKVMVCDVTVWEGTKDGDQAEIMDCVSYFDRQRIEHVFGVGAPEPIDEIDPAEIAKIQARADRDMAGKDYRSIEKIEDIIAPPKKRGRPRKNKDAA